MTIKRISPKDGQLTVEEVQMDVVLHYLLNTLSDMIRLLILSEDVPISYYFDDPEKVVEISIGMFETYVPLRVTYELLQNSEILEKNGTVRGDVLDAFLTAIYQNL